MNQTFRVAVAALLCVGVAACAQKTTVKQPETTPERQASTERATSGVPDAGSVRRATVV